MVDRIRDLLNWHKLTPTQFADAIQVGRPIISHILSGRNKASLDVVQRIVAAFPEVALPWLLSGTGPMLGTAGQVVSTTLAAPAAAASAAAGEVLSPVAPAVAGPKTPGKAARTPLTHLTTSATSSERRPSANTPSAAEPFLRQESNLFNNSALESNSRQPIQKFSVGGSLPPVTTAAPVAPDAGELPPIPLVGAADYSNELRSAVMMEADGPAAGAADGAALPPPQASARGEAALASRGIDNAGQQSMVLAADKSIRRIVIFYQDGSFADFKPES